ncbi:fluoride efflux transporter CrcB [Sphingomonas sp.]|uniref:fluoride efflux transporter CrcB n=1 Tax=Sphingomonas sp. TaxID=28214 RepID=UPI0037514189
MLNPLLVFVGGGLGALLRYAAGRAALLVGWAPPLATLGVNIVGCFAMGLLAGWFAAKGGSESARLFLLTGVLGGFTTFSAFGLDALTLWRTSPAHAAAYVAASVIVSLLAVFLGFSLAR